MDSRILFLLVVIPMMQVLSVAQQAQAPNPPKPPKPPTKKVTIIPPKPVCQCRKVNGRWTEWTAFSPCLASCGKGEQVRYRYCANPLPQHGGKKCKGQSKQTKKCNGIKPCPVNGGYSKFKWGKCSKPCGGGVQSGKALCNNPTTKHCGKPCPKPFLTKTRKCNVGKCPCPKDPAKGCKKWKQESCKKCNCKTKKRECSSKCILADPKHCEYGRASLGDCTPEQLKKCKPIQDEGLCEPCHKKALDEASGMKGHWKTAFPGHSCRASEIGQQLRALEYCKDLSKNAKLSKTKNAPAFKWFYIQCSSDGPWCKPCATRGQRMNVERDRCE